MARGLTKKSILRKTFEIGVSSIISKILGIMREVLQVRYLGISPISDAFTAAYKIPNSLRKIFAEGALSAAFIPTLVKVIKDHKFKQANKLMTLLIIVVSSMVLFICLLIFIFPKPVIWIYASGFLKKPIELAATIKLIRILIFFIFFVSLAALFAGAMQAKNHFSVPAWGPALLNIVYITGLILSLYFNLSVYVFSLFLLLAGLLQVLFFLYYYNKLGFDFAWPDASVKIYFKEIMVYKFLPCLFSVGALELNSIIDNHFASKLPVGTYTLMSISFRFMSIVLSAFATAFSSILLSHFSRITTYAPRRLSFYLLEAGKLIFWVTIPSMLFVGFFSYEIIYTTFYKFSNLKFSLENVNLAAKILVAYVSGLFFYSLNRLLLSIYYSLHQTFLPTIVTIIGTLFNLVFNILLINKLGAIGLAISTALSSIAQAILFLWLLRLKFNFDLYLKFFSSFFVKFSFQLFIANIIFYILYKIIEILVKYYLTFAQDFLLNQLGLWFWLGPLILLTYLFLYKTRSLFGIKIYFLG